MCSRANWPWYLLAMQDSLSDDALMPLKSYKYQSVDKSFISRYILKHYVCACRVCGSFIL